MFKSLSVFIVLILILMVGGCDSTHSFTNIFHSSYTVERCKYWSVLLKGNFLLATSVPVSCSSNYLQRTMHYILIAYDTKNCTYTVSILGGAEYMPGTQVIIKVNYKEYYLPVDKDRAWLTNGEDVKNFLKDLQVSDHLIVINHFKNSTYAVDTYSLDGFNKCKAKMLLTNTTTAPATDTP